MSKRAELSRDVLLQLYTMMLRIRLFEDRTAVLYPEQLVKCPVHLCIGQEAIAAGVCAHLAKKDYIFSTHRSHGHCIAKGMDLKTISAELYGRSNGCAKGRGGSMHLVDFENGIPGTTAIVGGCIPLAVGAALAAVKMKTGRISVAFFGDGATEEGSFHESLNYASLKKLPVVFVCENNFYATNSPQRARQPEVNIADRAAGYGIPGIVIDGNDVQAVYASAGYAVERARSGSGPTLLEFRTYRWKGHVGPLEDIKIGCRPADEHEAWLKKCPVDKFDRLLRERGLLNEEEASRINSMIEAEVDEAIAFGKSGAEPDGSELYDYVY
ncbi:MAG: thiamine pyrophosphate-dependent dehydrogenase E1 component subunit alpha [Nitrospiraceae bacterium]|nr:thiamine pyrophosphate-dependent dehydrogenase E1 component subunit alpha [Nitrospiraceae bacterium]